ncbi:hypothetical protein RB195_008668 [Necator americanus]
MRSSFVIIIVILAIQVERCEAFFGWISNAWNAATKWASNAARDAVKWVKDTYDGVQKKIDEMFAPLKRFGEEGWSCGADSVWITKVMAKISTIMLCKGLVKDINEACVHHDQCYLEKKETRITCDMLFCEKLAAIKKRVPTFSLCVQPDHFCLSVLYGGVAVY